jgi:hypothetical protein
MDRPAEKPATPPEEKPAPRATPFRSFTRVEDERQREWLFRRHRQRREPEWRRD